MRNKNDRYALVCCDELIVDYFSAEMGEDKEAYNLMDTRYCGGVPKRHYTKQDLVDKLNWYDKQLNHEHYDDPKTLIDFENRVLPQLNNLITSKVKELPVYESDKVDLAYCDIDYNTGEMERYQIECKIRHTDKNGYCPPIPDDLTKQLDEYTLTKVLVKINQYIDDFCKTPEEKLLLTGLRNEIGIKNI